MYSRMSNRSQILLTQNIKKMDNPIKEVEVSREVLRAAYDYGQEVLIRTGNGRIAIAAHDGFIAGASFSKPQEHNAKPEDKK
jgi:hypothetical protein